MLKAFVSLLLVLGLMSPLCLCGAVATDGHAALTPASHCHADHGDPCHEDDGSGEAPGHEHSHSDFRQISSGSIALPSIPAMDLADWEVILPEPPAVASIFPVRERAAISASDRERWSRSSATGVFLL